MPKSESSGSEKLLERLHQLLYEPLRAVLQREVKSTHCTVTVPRVDVDDVIHDAFADLAANAERTQFRLLGERTLSELSEEEVVANCGLFYRFLLRTCKNKYLGDYKRLRKTILTDTPVEESCTAEGEPNDFRDLVGEVLAQLTRAEQLVLVAHCDRQPGKETANHLGVDPSTVRSTLYRAKGKLSSGLLLRFRANMSDEEFSALVKELELAVQSLKDGGVEK